MNKCQYLNCIHKIINSLITVFPCVWSCMDSIYYHISTNGGHLRGQRRLWASCWSNWTQETFLLSHTVIGLSKRSECVCNIMDHVCCFALFSWNRHGISDHCNVQPSCRVYVGKLYLHSFTNLFIYYSSSIATIEVTIFANMPKNMNSQ